MAPLFPLISFSELFSQSASEWEAKKDHFRSLVISEMAASRSEFADANAIETSTESAKKEMAEADAREEAAINKSFERNGINLEETLLLEASRFATAMVSPDLRKNTVAFTKMAELIRVMMVSVLLCILAATV